MSNTSETSDIDSFTRSIAERFGETKPRPTGKIHHLAKLFGVTWVQEMADRAEQELATAGPHTLRQDGKQRTRGGVFFALAKQAALEAFQRKAISRKAYSKLFGSPFRGPKQEAAAEESAAD